MAAGGGCFADDVGGRAVDAAGGRAVGWREAAANLGGSGLAGIFLAEGITDAETDDSRQTCKY